MLTTHTEALSSSSQTMRVAQDLLHALGNGGYVIENALDAEAVEELHEEIRDAMRLPGGHALSRGYDKATRTGYTPPGVEGPIARNVSHDRHMFDYRPGGIPLRSHEDVLGRFYRKLEFVALQVLGLLHLATHRQAAKVVSRGQHRLRIAEYLNDETDPARALQRAHVDFSLFTLYVGGSSSGLQVQWDGEWVDATLSAGDLLVGAGMTAAEFYPGVRALQHRIVASSSRRVSAFFFMQPDPDVILRCGTTVAAFEESVHAYMRREI